MFYITAIETRLIHVKTCDRYKELFFLSLDQAKVLTPASATDDQLTSADVAALENALESIGVQRKRLLIEKEELTELKEEMAEYQEDIEELKDFLDSSSTQQPQNVDAWFFVNQKQPDAFSSLSIV